MELRQVRYFVTVAEEGNFSRAAERLRIAQSAISQQIKVLERSLGVRLFDRTARPVRLTSEGEQFLEHARPLLELADRAVEQMSAARGRGTVLRFGGSAFGNPPVIDELLSSARIRLPDVDLRIELDTTLHNVEALGRRTLDVVFAYQPFESDETPRYLRLGRAELVLAVPADHRFASSDRILREELLRERVLLGPRSINPRLADHVYVSLFGQTHHPLQVVLADMGPSRFDLVAKGEGITPVAFPNERLNPIPGVVYRRVEDPTPILEFGLLWFEDHVSPGLPAFLELARELADRGTELSDDMISIPDAGALR